MLDDPVDTDVVTELLLGMRLVGVTYRRIRAAPPFGMAFGETGRAQLHFVAQGPVWLRLPDGSTRRIGEGEAVLLPRGGRHELVSDPGCPAAPIESYACRPICPSVEAVADCPGGSCRNSDAVVFSGCMEFDLGGMHPLVNVMPEILQVGGLARAQPEIVPILEAMEREVRAERAGHAGILARLAEVVATSIVREWVECGCGSATGWIEALRDPRLGRVLLALHRDPGGDWTVARLAAEMGASRSAFAERFLAVTGMTPLAYLTELRMRLAARWIAQDRLPIEAAALRAGYASQAAFSRAFKRVTGHPPGALR